MLTRLRCCRDAVHRNQNNLLMYQYEFCYRMKPGFWRKQRANPLPFCNLSLPPLRNIKIASKDTIGVLHSRAWVSDARAHCLYVEFQMQPESAAAHITQSSTAAVPAKYSASLVSKRSLSSLTNSVIVIQVS